MKQRSNRRHFNFQIRSREKVIDLFIHRLMMKNMRAYVNRLQSNRFGEIT